MEAPSGPTFRPTLTVWPAEPPQLPPVAVRELRRDPAPHSVTFTAWDPWPQPETTITIPEDFCLRECLATNPDDLDDVFGFTSRWGLLSPPHAHLRPPLDALPPAMGWLIPMVEDTATREALTAITQRPADPAAHTGIPHSLHVQAHYLRALRALVGQILAARNDQPLAAAWRAEGFSIDDEQSTWGLFILTLNAALKPFAVHVSLPEAQPLLDTPSIYEVAALQLTRLIAEDRQLLTCANERCRRPFTRQRGRAKYDNSGHSSGVIYCSHHCAKAQSERTRRARLRAETKAARESADA